MISGSQKKPSPFGEGTSWDFNACVGTNGGPYNYASYASGYLQTANSVAKQFIETRGLAGVSIDVAIYPLLYLYRQGIELMMKHYIYDRRSRPKNDTEHDLKKLWDKASVEMKTILEPVFGKDELAKVMEKIEDFILKMHTLDPRGQVMRFPEDPFGNPFLQDYSIINIEPIYMAGQEVETIFDALVDGLAEASEFESGDFEE